MERVPGVQIFKKWDEMGELNRISIIKRLTQWECELSGIRFPAFGNLYHKGSLRDHELIPLDPSLDPEGVFGIGPSCGPAWSLQYTASVDCGPCKSSLSPGLDITDIVTLGKTIGDLGESLVNRSLLKSTDHPNPDLPPSLSGTPEEHLLVLDMTKKIMPAVANNPKVLAQSKPTLWHTDLHMGNIFVAEDDPGQVTGFIDWQHTSISPLFLQVRWPIFLTPPEDYPEGNVIPQLPPGFEEMDANDKEIALYKKKKNTWSKAYEVATFLNDREGWRAMQVSAPLKELFRRCGETWDEGIVPLRETLLEIFRTQQDLGFEEGLSIAFTDEQIAVHSKTFQDYLEWHEMRSFVKQVLDTDDEGWITPERDFAEMQTRNKMVFDYYVSKPGMNKTPDELRKLWPFP